MLNCLSKAPKSKLRGTAILRLDFNTQDSWRMEAALPTIRRLLRTAERVVIISHRGRPTGVQLRHGYPYGFDSKVSLKKDALVLQKLLKKKVGFIPHFRFEDIRTELADAPKHSLFLLENLRFIKGESDDKPHVARALASLGDFFVDEAFAVAHRTAASDVGITRFLPSYAGLGLEKEVAVLSKVMKKPAQPLVLILGGGKAHDKMGVLRHFKKSARFILFGGAPANTLLSLSGVNVKQSLIDQDISDFPDFQNVLKYPSCVLPRDFVVEKDKIVDIGHLTTKEFIAILKTARTVIWSGPLGRIEKKRFTKGSLAIARTIVANKKAFSVTGGGETVMFLKKYKLDKKFSFISTGGSAMLDFLAGEKLPGVEVLKK